MSAARVLGLLLFASGASAQVPDGHYVVGTFADPGKTPGGLFFVDPRVPGNPISVGGLGADLTGAGATRGGVNCVTIRRLDGALLVGEIGVGGVQIDLHVIHLLGNTVGSDVTHTVGIVGLNTGGGINQMAVLPNQDVLIGVSGLLPQAPLNGAILGIVSTFRNTVTPVPLTPQPLGGVNALAVDATGTTAYIAVATGASSAIYSVPVPGGGVPRLITTLQGVGALEVDRFGRLITMQAAISPPGIYSVDPVTGNAALLGTVGNNPNALNLERATDHVVYALNGFGPLGPGVFWMTRAGASTLLTNAVTGVPAGMDVNHDPWTYGQPTPGTVRYAWQVEPNPGGLPQLGNNGFSVSVRATPTGSASGIVMAATSPGSVNVAGLQVLLSPARIFLTGIVPATGDVSLPVPADVSLAGAAVFLQSFHLDAGGPLGLAASDGVEVGILR